MRPEADTPESVVRGRELATSTCWVWIQSLDRIRLTCAALGLTQHRDLSSVAMAPQLPKSRAQIWTPVLLSGQRPQHTAQTMPETPPINACF